MLNSYARLITVLSVTILGACTDPVIKPHSVTRTVGQQYVNSPFNFVGDRSVEVGGSVYELPETVAPIRLTGDVCEVATGVLVDVLGLPFSCMAEGTFHFHTGDTPLSGVSVLDLFVDVMRGSGSNVILKKNKVVLLGEVSGSGGEGSASGEDVISSGASYRFVGPEDVALVVSERVRVQRSSVFVDRVAGDEFVAEALEEVVRYSDLDAEIITAGEFVYVVGSVNDVRAVVSVSRAGEEVTVPLVVSSLSEATVSALRLSFDRLRFAYDPDGGQLLVSGGYHEVTEALSTIKRSVRAPGQIRLKAALVEYSSNDGTNIGSALRGSTGNVSVSAGEAGTTLAVGGSLKASLTALNTTGRASVLLEPSLLMSDGGSARFVSGDQVPVVTETTEDETGDRLQSVEYRDTGVVIDASVARRFDGAITVKLDWSVTGVRDTSGVAGNPVFTTRSITTEFTVTDGQTVALSGLVDVLDSFAGTKVPGLPHGLLGTRKTTRSKTKLVMFVTPEVLNVAGNALFND